MVPLQTVRARAHVTLDPRSYINRLGGTQKPLRYGVSTHLSNDSQLIYNRTAGQGSQHVRYLRQQHRIPSIWVAAAQGPGKVPGMRVPALAVDVLIYNIIFLHQFVNRLSQITQMHSSNVFIKSQLVVNQCTAFITVFHKAGYRVPPRE